jgi:hypothetical protein
MCKQGTAGERKHINLMIPQKLEIIRKLESGESQREVMASYSVGSSSMYDTERNRKTNFLYL